MGKDVVVEWDQTCPHDLGGFRQTRTGITRPILTTRTATS